jgi:transcription-repair coupling factor (superfamily II helicase)
MDDQEDAAYLYNDIQSLLGEHKALYFPASARAPYQFSEQTQNANIIQRAEVLTEINASKKRVIVTYPEALAEKVITQKALQNTCQNISIGDSLDMDFLIEVLFEYEFHREQFVTEPGQFAVRGGIIDVWSFSNDRPYRIEFFGDEIDSIRSFDPADQISVNRFNKITLTPNVQERLKDEQQISLIEYLSNQATFWVKNVELLFGRVEKNYDKAQIAWDKIKAQTVQLPPEKYYLNVVELQAQIEATSVVEFGSKFVFKADEVIRLESQAQPSFNKNFELLIEHLHKLQKDNYTTYILSDKPKQLERIQSILNDFEIEGKQIGKDIQFQPVLSAIHEGFKDDELKIALYTDHQIFDRYHRFKLKDSFKRSKQALTIQELTGLQKGDYVTHIDHGIGVFDGLEILEVGDKKQEAIRLLYKDKDVLYVSIQSLHRVAKYSGKEGKIPKVNKLGTNTWKNKKAATKSKVKEIAYDLIQLYAKRKSSAGFAFSKDHHFQNELEASFVFEDTPDQEKATIDVKKGMERPFPMDRLICGDVGFGKTEIAIRAAFKAAVDGKQVAVLVPTTILAFQHFKTFKERLEAFPITVDYINRFRSTKQQKETLQKLEEGKVDIIIGTHRLVGKDIKYKDLGLLIIDEEQKFGVAVKDKLKTIKANLDTLTLTATPIPRTLQFSLLGARDLSVINTPPPNRYPVETTVIGFSEETIRDAITYELSRGGQVFFIHNRVQNIKEVAGALQRLVPNAKIAIGHGQMDGKKLEGIMMDFMNGDYDILIATTIIESGLDIPNANTIIINSAQNFGLSDLHQMRGRVGRTNKKAFCYLVAPPLSSLTPEARKRLRALEEFSELGSGFNIAMRDLDIRGAGDLLGAEQSGFISDLGYETYQKVLDEAIQELKEGEFRELYEEELQEETRVFVKDCQIDTDFEILIPSTFVNAVDERLKLYKRLNEIENETALEVFTNELIDRFGQLPTPVEELINTMRLKWLAQKIGFERLYMKNGILRGYFISNPESDYYQSAKFGRILKYMQTYSDRCKMKEIKSKLAMTFKDVRNIQSAKEKLQHLAATISLE